MSTEIASIRSGLPPGPKGTIVGGNSRQFRACPLAFLLDTVRDYGPLASFRVGPRRVFLASGPDLIEQVLVTDARHYIKHFGARAFKPVLGNGLVTSEGALWHRQRKLIQPAFLKIRVQSYAPIMAELTDQMLDAWSPGKSVQIDYEFEALTSKIALKTLFDLEDSGDRQRFSGTLKLAFELMNVRLRRIFKLPLWVPTPANLRLQAAVGELDRTVEGFIASGRSRRDVGNDLLSRLLVAQHEDGTRMSDLQLRDEAMTLYLAGHETTAPEPEEFRPERWENGLAKRLPKFAYYPFGGGQRLCVGSSFALMEAAIILAAVGQRYRFTLDPDAVIGIKPQITLLPANGIPATLERR